MGNIQVMPSPQHLDIAITGKCNLACEYCFYADEMPGRSDLPTERWLAFFEELGRLEVMNVTLTGGEVFSRSDLFELIDSLVANRMRYSLLSNGTLISEKTVKQLETGQKAIAPRLHPDLHRRFDGGRQRPQSPAKFCAGRAGAAPA